MTKLGLAITAEPLLFSNYFSKALKARSIAGLNGFLRQTGKEPTTYQEVQWANKSSCTYMHTYVQLCGISAHSGGFLAVFKTFGRIVGISMAFFATSWELWKHLDPVSRGQFYIFKPEWPKESINGFKTISCRPYRLGVFSNYCLYIQHTYNFAACLRTMEHFLTVFKNFGRISGISMAFFTKPEKSLPLVKKFNGQIKAHVPIWKL